MLWPYIRFYNIDLEKIVTREDAINKMLAALDEFVIEGIDTIIPYHKQILNDQNFKNGDFDTSFIEHFEYIKEYDNEHS